MADPKRDDLVARAAAAASVDPLAHMREMMRAVGVVQIAGRGGDGGGRIPAPVAPRGDPFALVNAPFAVAPFNPVQGAGQVASQTRALPGHPFGTNVTVSQPRATGMHGFGQTQPWPVGPAVRRPGTLPESPNPADSCKWVLDHIARQDPPMIGQVMPTTGIYPSEGTGPWFPPAPPSGGGPSPDRRPLGPGSTSNAPPDSPIPPAPPTNPIPPPIDKDPVPCWQEVLDILNYISTTDDQDSIDHSLEHLEDMMKSDSWCVIWAIRNFLWATPGVRSFFITERLWFALLKFLMSSIILLLGEGVSRGGSDRKQTLAKIAELLSSAPEGFAPPEVLEALELPGGTFNTRVRLENYEKLLALLELFLAYNSYLMAGTPGWEKVVNETLQEIRMLVEFIRDHR